MQYQDTLSYCTRTLHISAHRDNCLGLEIYSRKILSSHITLWFLADAKSDLGYGSFYYTSCLCQAWGGHGN